jgi:hypothetical protein
MNTTKRKARATTIEVKLPRETQEKLTAFAKFAGVHVNNVVKIAIAEGVLRLVAEFDRLRWELAGADDRARVAREERDKLDSLYWTLKMTKLPGGPI